MLPSFSAALTAGQPISARVRSGYFPNGIIPTPTTDTPRISALHRPENKCGNRRAVRISSHYANREFDSLSKGEFLTLQMGEDTDPVLKVDITEGQRLAPFRRADMQPCKSIQRAARRHWFFRNVFADATRADWIAGEKFDSARLAGATPQHGAPVGLGKNGPLG